MTHTWLQRMTHTLFLPLSFSSSLSLTPPPSLCSPLSPPLFHPPCPPPPSLSFPPSIPLPLFSGREEEREGGREGGMDGRMKGEGGRGGAG